MSSPSTIADLLVQRLGWDFADMAESVTIRAFVRAPFDGYVHDETRFWNASGLSVKLAGAGVQPIGRRLEHRPGRIIDMRVLEQRSEPRERAPEAGRSHPRSQRSQAARTGDEGRRSAWLRRAHIDLLLMALLCFAPVKFSTTAI